ncbi:hypothetical protein GPJ56_007627 [Histomonas meleagridis]|uniref:uncharacterized protein n=1 Tax=Histomonas meleagridis TaxID=135588 RepID=UPI00355A9CDF|nr:hypothetical protein GPJ56_007627 [Histomonas meleagridis]KAH0803583.1 hypothetical protein GO595_003634 [Histomonas meleagridis]
MSKKLPSLSGSYHNIEHAIIEAIHLLAPLSEYNDGSCRCKDIFLLVKNATIQIGNQLQQGNHRFTLFSSALCGRRSSFKLFQKVTDKERHGSWWKLKVSYEEALSISSSLPSRNQSKFLGVIDNNSSSPTPLFASRSELIQRKFLSLIPFSIMEPELINNTEELENEHTDISNRLQIAKSEAPPDVSQALLHLNNLKRQFEDLTHEKQAYEESQTLRFFQ